MCLWRTFVLDCPNVAVSRCWSQLCVCNVAFVNIHFVHAVAWFVNTGFPQILTQKCVRPSSSTPDPGPGEVARDVHCVYAT